MTDSSIIKKNRNSTIEALKLFLMFGVVVLHICGDQGRAIELSRGGDLQTFRALFICAVDCFMVISGYYLSISNTRNIVKVLSLYAIAVLFSLSTNIVSSILNGNFIIVEILKSFIIGNYFLLLYSAVYIYLHLLI